MFISDPEDRQQIRLECASETHPCDLFCRVQHIATIGEPIRPTGTEQTLISLLLIHHINQRLAFNETADVLLNGSHHPVGV